MMVLSSTFSTVRPRVSEVIDIVYSDGVWGDGGEVGEGKKHYWGGRGGRGNGM